MIRLLLLASFCAYFTPIFTQIAPSNLYLFDFNQSNSKNLVFSNPKFLTSFNARGYNNQPHFLNENQVLFSMSRSLEPLKTDLILLDLKAKSRQVITQTPQSEFSPTKIPFQNAFSTVLIEADDSTQRLWKYPLDHKSQISPIFSSLKNVGYYHWLNADELVVFIVGKPHSLVLVNLKNKSIKQLAKNVGRCFVTLEEGKIAFIDKNNAVFWHISEMALNTFETKPIIATLPKVEDFAMLEDGTFLMGKGSKIYAMNPKRDRNWELQADFSFYDINHISRIIIGRNNQLIIVN